jgi:hypothetical protein
LVIFMVGLVFWSLDILLNLGWAELMTATRWVLKCLNQWWFLKSWGISGRHHQVMVHDLNDWGVPQWLRKSPNIGKLTFGAVMQWPPPGEFEAVGPNVVIDPWYSNLA